MPIEPTGFNPNLHFSSQQPELGLTVPLYSQILQELQNGNSSQASSDLTRLANACSQYGGPAQQQASGLASLF